MSNHEQLYFFVRADHTLSHGQLVDISSRLSRQYPFDGGMRPVITKVVEGLHHMSTVVNAVPYNWHFETIDGRNKDDPKIVVAALCAAQKDTFDHLTTLG